MSKNLNFSHLNVRSPSIGFNELKPCITGEPASLREETHPDWVPSINMGYDSHVCDRYKRLQDGFLNEVPSRGL
ncbi:hypothetical protein JTB14_019658 [Gonioctena quinquepunctata]|nr:hypothetical protein JTB14_019658 [Gonioctena quinquepunctata]